MLVHDHNIYGKRHYANTFYKVSLDLYIPIYMLLKCIKSILDLPVSKTGFVTVFLTDLSISSH